MNKKAIILTIFTLITILDALMAILVKLKQPYFNEANPIYIFTGSISLALGLKFGFMALLFFYFLKPRWYYFNRLDAGRFGMAIVLVIAIVGQFNGMVSGIREFSKPKEMVQQVPENERLAYYQQTNYSLGYSDAQKNPLTNLIVLYFFMIICFIVYETFENANKEKFVEANYESDI